MPNRLDIPPTWTFERDDVAAVFDQHVREQLPWYELATRAAAQVASHYITPGGLVYDIGSATGNIGRALDGVLQGRGASLVAIESSPSMVSAYQGPGTAVCCRAEEYAYEPCDLAVAFLTFSFIPPPSRGAVLGAVLRAVRPGGAVIVFDKEERPAGYVGTVLHHLTTVEKVRAGASLADVARKELSLIGVQRPLPVGWLPEAVEVFRFGEFAGWVIEKGELS